MFFEAELCSEIQVFKTNHVFPMQNSPNSACTEGVLTVLLKKVLWFLCQPVHGTRPLIFAAISHTSCMSPSPLCSESVAFFKYAVNYNTKSTFLVSDGPWSLLSTYVIFRMPFWSYLGDILTKYEQKCNFFKMSMSQNFRNVSCSEIKAPRGATRHKGAFENWI